MKWLTLLAFAASAIPLHGARWEPIDPADLAATESTIQPTAGAEIIHDRTVIKESVTEGFFTRISRSGRIKIFTEQGAKDHSVVNVISFIERGRISGLRARVIHPDGTINELSSKELKENFVAKRRRSGQQMDVYSIPKVEPGCIIDFAYRASKETIARDLRLYLQKNLPAREIRYEVQPIEDWPSYAPPLYYRRYTLRADEAEFQKVGRLGFEVTMRNKPAYVREPLSFPTREYLPVVITHYMPYRAVTEEEFWDAMAKSTYTSEKEGIRINRKVKDTAKRIVKGAQSDVEKAEMLFDWCRAEIRNITDRQINFTEGEKEKSGEMSCSKVIEEKFGSPRDIRLTYIAMCRAVGLDARTICLPDSDYVFFNSKIANTLSLPRRGVALKVEEKWLVCRPGDLFLPFGMVSRQESGFKALISGKKKGTFITCPKLTHEENKVVTRMNLQLDTEGNLQGTVTRTLYGYHAYDLRRKIYNKGKPGHRNLIKKDLETRLPGVLVRNPQYSNIRDYKQPLMLEFTIEIPHYAETTAKRIILKPSIWRAGRVPPLKDEKRVLPIYFPARTKEIDKIRIRVPDGYAPERASSPAPIKFAAYSSELTLGYSAEKGILGCDYHYHSDLGVLPQSKYLGIRTVLNKSAEMNNHQIILRKEE